MFALVLTIYEIFAKQINFKKVALENDNQGQDVEKRDFCHLKLEIFESI